MSDDMIPAGTPREWAKFGVWRACLDEQHKEITALRRLLATLQWSGPFDGCPSCGLSARHGHHASDCRLDAALKEVKR